MKKLLLLLLIVGCDEALEPEDCAGVVGGTAVEDECGVCVGGNTGLESCIQDCEGIYGGDTILDDCGICGGKLSCIYGDWATSDSLAYYSIDEENFKMTSGFTCSGIGGNYNIIEFSDSCLNTNLAIQNEFYSYSFKLSDYNQNILYINLVEVNLESLQSAFDLENCKMVDSLIRVNELVNAIDGTPCSY